MSEAWEAELRFREQEFRTFSPSTMEPVNPLIYALDDIAPAFVQLSTVTVAMVAVADLLFYLLGYLFCGRPQQLMTFMFTDWISRSWTWYNRDGSGVSKIVNADLIPRVTDTADIAYKAINKMVELFDERGAGVSPHY